MKRQGSVAEKGWAFWRWFNILDPYGDLYLRRLYVIATPWFSVMIHWIVAPDPDRDPHDHPWSFYSFIWRGGYYEWVYPQDGRKQLHRHERWSGHLMRAEGVHKIEEVEEGTITVVITGPRRREWGFSTPGGWVHYKDYLLRHKPAGEVA